MTAVPNVRVIESNPFEETIERLSKDIKAAARTLERNALRYFVDTYYQMQEARIRSAGQVSAMTADGTEPHACMAWLSQQNGTLERRVHAMLDEYTKYDPVCSQIRRVLGIGPVIAAGLRAHIDIEKAPNVSHVWSFAGLCPHIKWEKGQRRPWNAELKTLTAFKMGSCFVKLANHERSFFGLVYRVHKRRITEANERGEFKEQAAAYLAGKKFGPTTQSFKAYTDGKLPKSQIVARARRVAAKFALGLYFDIAYEQHHGKAPPLPWVIKLGGHEDHITADDIFAYEDGQYPREQMVYRLGGNADDLKRNVNVEEDAAEDAGE